MNEGPTDSKRHDNKSSTGISGAPIDEAEIAELMARERETALPFQFERGFFLDHMSTIEGNLGGIICNHFEVPSERRYEFLAWVLDGTSFAQKVQFLRRIIVSRGLQERFGPLADRLVEANRFRNVLAHSLLQVGVEEEVVFLQFGRADIPMHKLSLAELRRQVRRLVALGLIVSQVGGALTGDTLFDAIDVEEQFGDVL